jgi:integrase
MLVDRDLNGIWHIDLSHPVTGKRVRQSTKTRDRQKAELIHAKVLNELFESRWETKAKVSDMTLAEGYDKLFKQHWAHIKSADTVGFNYQRLLRFLDADTKLRELTTDSMWDVIEEMRTEYPDSTINRSLAVVSTLLITARDTWEILGRTPKIPKLKEGKGRLRWLQDGEEETITGWFRDRGDADMSELIEALLDTGCRLSEMLKLDRKDVLLDQRNILLWNTKNGDWDAQPLTERALQILARRTKMYGSPFSGLTRHAAIHRFQTMKKHCGYQDDRELCLHTMRHTTASRLVMKGTDVRRVQQFMRHADINTTLRYAKLNTEEKRRTAEVLEVRV